MIWASVFYLGTTIVFFIVFAVMVARTCSRRRKKQLEEPKHRMLQDD